MKKGGCFIRLRAKWGASEIRVNVLKVDPTEMLAAYYVAQYEDIPGGQVRYGFLFDSLRHQLRELDRNIRVTHFDHKNWHTNNKHDKAAAVLV